MFYGLVNVTYFDLVTVGFTFAVLIAVQILNALWALKDKGSVDCTDNCASVVGDDNFRKLLKINENGTEVAEKTPPILHKRSPSSPVTTATSATSPAATPPPTTKNGKLQKQQSEQCENHEDEDTISLENLLPCDHTEIYSSNKISYIIDELLQTEGNYINNLKKGLQNYGNLDKYDKLPESLRGEDKKQQLLGNIKEILDLHEKQILPLMLGNQRDLKTMFDEMTSYIDKNQFYCYVTFTMHKQTSMQLRKDNREWFQNYQNEINDRLGIDSFLVQPIQRLTRYPLLLSQFISEFYKSGINCKPVLVSVCKLETRLRRLLEVVNQSEEVLSIEELPTEFTIDHFGAFRRSTEFEAYSCRSRKKFKAKVFLFDQYLVCVEIRKRRLAYRNHYSWGSIELKLNSSKSVSLLMKSTHGAGSSNHSLSSAGSGSGKSSRDNSIKEEYEFSAPEAISVTQWLRCARKIFENARIEESQRGKFSLPMDLVLGAVFAIWLIWHYLY
ncbi:pleckstrin homology domain-containing family G member 4B isoform X2 [Musca domestica]|uniref:Pleckstrin homology domain-containing family G member 4B isoform X2 n=1 Tax=Musca domestica TaxID=7370 RepID=A0ABM3VF52_MUSDO|nr:pleckstrin homology domain-containing family G member 4B isoform X2 [Musca domestica]